ncbi:MAG: hypothetical protein IJS32_01960 [Kiritimatiellae bacterium]|nr:hypothetical protein [Kiritimatiellia bacterium]
MQISKQFCKNHFLPSFPPMFALRGAGGMSAGFSGAFMQNHGKEGKKSMKASVHAGKTHKLLSKCPGKEAGKKERSHMRANR